jgi:hypothetical protein
VAAAATANTAANDMANMYREGMIQ